MVTLWVFGVQYSGNNLKPFRGSGPNIFGCDSEARAPTSAEASDLDLCGGDISAKLPLSRNLSLAKRFFCRSVGLGCVPQSAPPLSDGHQQGGNTGHTEQSGDTASDRCCRRGVGGLPLGAKWVGAVLVGGVTGLLTPSISQDLGMLGDRPRWWRGLLGAGFIGSLYALLIAMILLGG